MKYLRVCLLVGFVAAVALVLWWIRRPQVGVEETAATPPPARSAPVAAVETPAAEVAAPVPASEPQNQAELAATARMYAAHAPLRVPEVADPDSATNRQILGTMVTKALAQPASDQTK